MTSQEPPAKERQICCVLSSINTIKVILLVFNLFEQGGPFFLNNIQNNLFYEHNEVAFSDFCGQSVTVDSSVMPNKIFF